MKILSLPDGSRSLVGMCPHCRTNVQLSVRATAARNEAPLIVWLCVCPVCGRGLIVDAGSPADPGAILSVAPGLRKTFPDVDYERDVPGVIRSILDQAYAAQKEGAWTLVGLGCRAAMERMAALHGATEGMLGKKLEVMRQKFPGLAGPLENADLVRLVGNVAAHDSDRDLTESEAAAAIEFVEEVLRDVYILPARRKRVGEGLKGR